MRDVNPVVQISWAHGKDVCFRPWFKRLMNLGRDTLHFATETFTYNNFRNIQNTQL